MFSLCRARRTTCLDHIPREYVVIEHFGGCTRQACEQADTFNQKLYSHRKNLIASHTGVTAMGNIAPPAHTNVERYDVWVENHAPQRADEQSAAVVALLDAGYTYGTGFRAHTAVAIAKNLRPTLPRPKISAHRQDKRYTVFDWDDLYNRTMRECEDADKKNNALYTRIARMSVAAQVHTSTAAGWAHAQPCGPKVPPSNVRLKSAQLRRATKVSALNQTEAVLKLIAVNMYPGRDYEPQDAMHVAKYHTPYNNPMPTAPPPPRQAFVYPQLPDAVRIEIPDHECMERNASSFVPEQFGDEEEEEDDVFPILV